MEQARLSHLALLCIERLYIKGVDIEKVIDGFASRSVSSTLAKVNPSLS